MKKIYLTIFLLAAMTIRPCWATEEWLNIVTTQTIFVDLVKEVGGDKVNVSAIASPKYNIHFIQPKPSDSPLNKPFLKMPIFRQNYRKTSHFFRLF